MWGNSEGLAMVTFPIAESLTWGKTKDFWREKLRPEQIYAVSTIV